MRTITAGVVRERELPDGSGRADVEIHIETNKALTWFGPCFPEDGPPVLGARVAEILEDLEGATPVLNGKSRLEVSLVNSALGAPLPDVIEGLAFPNTAQSVTAAIFTGSARGKLRAPFDGDTQVTLTPLGPGEGDDEDDE